MAERPKIGREWYRNVYLKSEHWIEFAKEMRQKSGGVCSRCWIGTWELDVHHLNYDHLWHETENDVEVLCRRCHKREHEQQNWQKSNRNIQLPSPREPVVSITEVAMEKLERDRRAFLSDIRRCQLEIEEDAPQHKGFILTERLSVYRKALNVIDRELARRQAGHPVLVKQWEAHEIV